MISSKQPRPIYIHPPSLETWVTLLETWDPVHFTALLSWQVSLITSPLCRKYKFKSAVWTHHFWLKILEASIYNISNLLRELLMVVPQHPASLWWFLCFYGQKIYVRQESIVGRRNFRLAWPIFRCYVRFREGIQPNTSLSSLDPSCSKSHLLSSIHFLLNKHSHTIHVCYIYLHLLVFNGKHMVNVRTYTSLMDAMGFMNRHPHIEHRPECPGSSRKLKQWCHSPNKLPDQSSKPTDAVWL